MAKNDSAGGIGGQAGPKSDAHPAPRPADGTPPDAAQPAGAAAAKADSSANRSTESSEPGPLLAKPQGAKAPDAARTPEIGGPKGPEPTRYGDWERAGRCIDF